jgi:hypothetical protein
LSDRKGRSPRALCAAACPCAAASVYSRAASARFLATPLPSAWQVPVDGTRKQKQALRGCGHLRDETMHTHQVGTARLRCPDWQTECTAAPPQPGSWQRRCRSRSKHLATAKIAVSW